MKFFQSLKEAARHLYLGARSVFLTSQPVSWAISFYLFVVLNDYISSSLQTDPRVHEGNPFARNALLQFVLWKGLVVDLMFGLGFGLTVYVANKIWQTIDPKWSKAAISTFLWYQAMDRLLNAVIPNYLFVFRMYVPEPHSLFDTLMRLLTL